MHATRCPLSWTALPMTKFCSRGPVAVLLTLLCLAIFCTQGPIVADKNCAKIHYIAPNI